jgi:hypothetical protein
LSVGQSAVGSVAEMTSALAPLLIAAWMAGICDDGVSAVPLVSDAVSPRVCSAARAPPELTLSEVVKYEFPRFLGMTKTLRPDLSEPPAAAAEDEAEVEAAAEAGAVVGVLADEEEDDEQAASAGATNRSGRASHVARLSLIVCILSIFGLTFGRGVVVGGD